MFTSIAGRAVVVTGGTRGIGKGIASVFARNGARVLITGRDSETGRAAADELQRGGAPGGLLPAGRHVQPGGLPADGRHRERAAGRLDVLCANAGIFPDSRLEDMTEEISTRCLAST